MKLAKLSSLSNYNDKYKYLYNVIGIFLRYASSVSVKGKTNISITAALKFKFSYDT